MIDTWGGFFYVDINSRHSDQKPNGEQEKRPKDENPNRAESNKNKSPNPSSEDDDSLFPQLDLKKRMKLLEKSPRRSWYINLVSNQSFRC